MVVVAASRSGSVASWIMALAFASGYCSNALFFFFGPSFARAGGATCHEVKRVYRILFKTINYKVITVTVVWYYLETALHSSCQDYHTTQRRINDNC